MKFEFSAGGIVFRKTEEEVLVLVCQHSQHHGWVFPKGLIGDRAHPPGGTVSASNKAHPGGGKETKEEAALREVKEETGVSGKILDELAPITYWYVFKKEKIKKTVYYFLMEYVSGDIADHDHEMENVEWLPIDKVADRLTYKSDKEVWAQVKLLLENPKSEYRNSKQ